jgi:hypothetical protein
MQNQSDAHVMTCLAERCSWNCMDECCAPKIEIGADHPACDTFTTGSVHPMDVNAEVEDCKVTDCHFNNAMACSAAGITLSTHSGHADCMTYRH